MRAPVSKATAMSGKSDTGLMHPDRQRLKRNGRRSGSMSAMMIRRENRPFAHSGRFCGHKITKETVKTIARGMPSYSGVTVVTNARAFYPTRAAAGASSARHSLRPLFGEGERFMHDSGGSRRGNADSCIRAGSMWLRPPRRTPARAHQDEGEAPCSSAFAIERKSCHAMRL